MGRSGGWAARDWWHFPHNPIFLAPCVLAPISIPHLGANMSYGVVIGEALDRDVQLVHHEGEVAINTQKIG